MNATEFLQSKYLRAGALSNGSIAKVRIVEVTEEVLGEEQERKLCLHFPGSIPALVLNRTQTRRMVELFGANTDGWINQAIALTVIPTTFKGEQRSTFAIDRLQNKKQAEGNPFFGPDKTPLYTEEEEEPSGVPAPSGLPLPPLGADGGLQGEIPF